MCTKRDIIQRDIDFAYHDSMHLRENIIRACRDYSTLVIDFINSVFDTLELINSSYAFIVNYETIYKSFTQETYVQSFNEDKKIENETYFTNRQYQKNRFNQRDRFKSSRSLFLSLLFLSR